ncbi:MAG: YbhB/YbcL family Raf kinase inhibitor-like protein [Rubrivivax sp.]|nr:YbhB/YbcL family Raf kinase inhibitor-like protein [Rubrivivax sp.]
MSHTLASLRAQLNGLRPARGLTALAFASMLWGCAAPNVGGPAEKGFSLWSPGRADNAMLDKQFAGALKTNPNCLGENVSPSLAWTRPPAGTRSFAILFDDQAGRAGLGVNHWVGYGLPANLTSLAEGQASVATTAWTAGKNTVGNLVYLGPCPPRGNAPQHYVFTLIATSVEPAALPAGLNKSELLDALRGKTLGAASQVFRYAH